MALSGFKKHDGRKLEWFRLIRYFIGVFIIGFVIFRFVIGFSFVTGNSMMPTIKHGTPVLYLRIENAYSVGDVVSIKMPSNDRYIKRIVAVPGDVVLISNGQLYVNNQLVNDEYGYITIPEEQTVFYPLTLGDSQYFVLGDNRGESVDSRVFGPITSGMIRGRIITVE